MTEITNQSSKQSPINFLFITSGLEIRILFRDATKKKQTAAQQPTELKDMWLI